MGAVTLLALGDGRRRAALPALGAAVCVLLLLDPGLARDAGFALSVAATAARSAGAHLVTAPAIPGMLAARRRPRRQRWPGHGATRRRALRLGQLWSPFRPTSSPRPRSPRPPCSGWRRRSLGRDPDARRPPRGAGWPTRWLVVAERAAALGRGHRLAGRGGRATLLTVLLLAVVWSLWRFPRMRPLALAALVGLVAIGWPCSRRSSWPPARCSSSPATSARGRAFVVPTGAGVACWSTPGRTVGAVDRCLDRLGIDVLPLVLMSHLDADHAGGLGALAGREVGVVATEHAGPSDEREEGRQPGPGSGGERTVLVPGDRRTVGTATIEVPPRSRAATAAAEANDLSMVVRITQRGVQILFTGDLSAQAEARILASGTDLGADVLKVPHHGSGTPIRRSSPPARPRGADLGRGGQHLRRPSRTRRLLTWLSQAGMRVHRTDRDGDLAAVGSAASWGVAWDGTGRGTAAAAGGRTGGEVSAPRDTMQACRPSWNPPPACAW